MNPIQSFLNRPKVAIPVVGVVIVAIVGFLYMNMTTLPAYKYVAAETGTVPGTITLTGTVAPSEEIDMAFLKSGNVTSVSARTGQSVSAGTVLASLSDQGTQGQLNQAKGAFEAAEANYHKVLNGTSDTDVAVSQSAVNSATVALANAKQTLVNQISTSYTNANTAVLSYTNVLFSNPQTVSPQFNVSGTVQTNSQAVADVNTQRVAVNNLLASWQTEVANIDTNNTDTVVADSIANLSTIDSYLANIISILTAYTQVSSGGSQTTVTTYEAGVATAKTAVDAAGTAITTDAQAVKSATSALAQVQALLSAKQATARPEDIELAKAQMDSAEGAYEAAQGSYNNNFIKAPINGTITFVNVKVGQNATPNQTVIGMVSKGTFQIDAYVDQAYLNRLSLGATTTVTFSGITDKTFVARIVDVDSGAVVTGSRGEYKVTFELEGSDPRINSGLEGTISVVGADKDNVLTVPHGALIEKDGAYFVLVKQGKTLKETAVTVGLVGTDVVEVQSGLQAGDTVAVVGE